MFLAVTNEVCQNVASVPLLWIVPLSLYISVIGLGIFYIITSWCAVSAFKSEGDMLVKATKDAGNNHFVLIDAGFIKQVSTKYDLQADGTVTTTGEPCT